MNYVKPILPAERIVKRDPKNIYDFRVIRTLDIWEGNIRCRVLCMEPIRERDKLWKWTGTVSYSVEACTPTDTEHVWDVTLRRDVGKIDG